jgi:MFS family permease
LTFGLSKAEAGAIGSILAAGLIIGGIIMGGVADRIGRVRALYLSILIYSVFTCLTAFAPSATWVAVSRFLGGLGMGAPGPPARRWSRRRGAPDIVAKAAR